MGLFDKKYCAVCGNKKGLIGGATLVDGNELCLHCAVAVDNTYIKGGISLNLRTPMKKMDLEKYKELAELREENKEKLESFESTLCLCKVVHIDAKRREILFVDDNTFNNKKALCQENPHVFKLDDMKFYAAVGSYVTKGQTITGKETAECTQYLVAGFDDPVFDMCKMEIGKLKAVAGFFKDKIKRSPEIDRLFNVLAEGVPPVDENEMWEYVSRARECGFVSKSDVRDMLEEQYGFDNKKIKEIKLRYNL